MTAAARSGLAGCLVLALAGPAAAFTQKSPITPIGHEFLTAASVAAMTSRYRAELDPPLDQPDEIDDERADCVLCDSYGTRSWKVWSAVLGNRWSDLMGTTLLPVRSQSKCFRAMAQENEDVQYDHFMRRRDDSGRAGGIHAIRESIARFRRYFMAAVHANETSMLIADGGAVRTHFRVNRAFFLFGRAAHLFQDSFSFEHTRRLDGQIIDVTSYFCTPDALYHARAIPGFLFGTFDEGDVIWKSPDAEESVDDLRPHARLAYDAMADLWDAFMTARHQPAKAQALLDRVVARWMFFREASYVGAVDPAHEHSCQATPLAVIESWRKQCLAHTGWVGKLPPYNWESEVDDDDLDDTPLESVSPRGRPAGP